jgi:hypothetical protein
MTPPPTAKADEGTSIESAVKTTAKTPSLDAKRFISYFLPYTCRW